MAMKLFGFKIRPVFVRLDSIRLGAYMRRKGVVLGDDVKVSGRIRVSSETRGSIRIEDSVVFNSDWRRNTLKANGACQLKTIRPLASILIGQDSGLTSVTISAAQSVVIGRRTLIGAGVVITDCDHHPVHPPLGVARRFAGLPDPGADSPVKIGDDVFIGFEAVVLKGVTIGDGSVIGARSVVTKSIPPGVVAAGNPCRPIGRVDSRPTDAL